MLENEDWHIALLIVRKVRGKLRRKGRRRLQQWAALSPENQHLLDEFSDRTTLIRQLLEYGEIDSEGIWDRLTAKIPSLRTVNTTPVYPQTSLRGRWDAIWHNHPWLGWILGTSFAVLAGVTVMLLLNRPTPERMTKPGRTATTPEITVASTKPIPHKEHKLQIILPNDSTLYADDLREGEIKKVDNIIISRERAGAIVYHNEGPGKNGLNKLVTPKGERYTIILPDGSKVHLNAASSLTFTTNFGLGERNVTLQGEAFFEVADHNPAPQKGKIPFVVNVPGKDTTRIFAVGTEFNVTAYEEDAFVKTTLLHGNVRVENPHRVISVKLQPGQQYVLYAQGKGRLITEADTIEAVAWKTDRFVFNDEPLHDVMRQLCRWYDVSVVYRVKTNIPISTSCFRTDSLTTVLQQLEGLGNLHYSIEDRKIVVER